MDISTNQYRLIVNYFYQFQFGVQIRISSARHTDYREFSEVCMLFVSPAISANFNQLIVLIAPPNCHIQSDLIFAHL